ncbi:MFS transporter [Paraburkholderia sp. Ac-20336]|uniref:MFS transporter n=1 Tax=unclassified Paraburkholderia TaxID=2615204 RepID=UPI00141F2CDE|nr:MULTISPECIES: MFS transporter [unclassified Paraburkholderia]MBN3801677.1 MFS transporter [Paraburkholderia sp. Ac-20336]MBN3849557.1 MFS transporter [Paraburkholderia sp. Ac-20342]NIF75944.1 MFS transporter [Paraburkholderia sp. Cy-641]
MNLESTADIASNAPASEAALSATVGRVARRLIPFLCILYFFAYLDRFNVGFAALTMNQDLGLSVATYGFAASMFFWGYILFEVPSNLVLGKIGARFWISRIMITWGLISAATIFVTGSTSLSTLRFLLGAAEAGFLPGILVYLTEWFPRADRARMIGLFQIAMPLSGVLGAPVSSLILAHMHGVAGLAGWKWLFLTQGLPSVLLGISCLWLLPSRPSEAKWLGNRERIELERVLDAERQQTEAVRVFSLREGFTNPRVLVLALLFFCLVCGSTGVGFFLPLIVKDFGLSTVQIGVVTAIPYLLAVIGMVWWSRRSDIKGKRIEYVALAAIFAAAGFLLAAFTLKTPVVAVIGLSMGCVGIFASFPVFWTLPPSFLTGTTAAASIAFINSLGNVSGIVGPGVIGWTRDVSGGFTLMLGILAVLMAIAAALSSVFARMNARSEPHLAQPHPNR